MAFPDCEKSTGKNSLPKPPFAHDTNFHCARLWMKSTSPFSPRNPSSPISLKSALLPKPAVMPSIAPRKPLSEWSTRKVASAETWQGPVLKRGRAQGTAASITGWIGAPKATRHRPFRAQCTIPTGINHRLLNTAWADGNSSTSTRIIWPIRTLPHPVPHRYHHPTSRMRQGNSAYLTCHR